MSGVDRIEGCDMSKNFHNPVMSKEVLDGLSLAPGKTIVDATVGTAGHSEQIIEKILPAGKLVCIDRDKESLEVARKRLLRFSNSTVFIHGNFSDLEKILNHEGIKKIDGILFDLGISSFQLDNAERGFTFQQDGPLDMRLDRDSYISAYDLVNNLHEDEISHLLWNFGQERWHRRIARVLVEQRQKSPISTTAQLADMVDRAIPYRYRRGYRKIHPATRTFQAIRIAVNRELEALETAINQAIGILTKKSRICVISFHSLEDRIAKHSFRKAAHTGLVKIITPKPATPLWSEIESNPRSRSAKLRVAERI